MRLVIHGHHLPGRHCGPYDDVHVGLQVRRDPQGLVPGDADRAEWVAEIRTDAADFRGPAVQGRKGAHFVYLTWGTYTNGTFTMFRRAKLMLADLPRGGHRRGRSHRRDGHAAASAAEPAGAPHPLTATALRSRT